MTEYHVQQNLSGAWIARRTGAVRASKLCLTKTQAIRYASQRATVVVIHGRDGRVSSIHNVVKS